MKQVLRILIACVMTIACITSAYAADNEINIVGSTTVLPIAQIAAETFMNSNPGINITVGGGGSSIGAKALLAGTCDIADCSRPLKSKEMVQAAEAGIDPKPHVIAMDGIAVIVNNANALSAISLEQIKGIYTGDINDWSQLGAGSGKIVVISRDSASGTFEAFNELALKQARVRPDALLQASNKAVATTVQQTPNAIGYVGMGYVTKELKALPVDGVLPVKDTVLTKEYPIARPLYMYTNGDPKGAVKKFLDFVKSKEGQALAESQGFVGLV